MEFPSDAVEYNLYKFIPPPLPLICDALAPVLSTAKKQPQKKVPVISRNDPVYVLHEEILAQQVPEPKPPSPAPRKRRQLYSEALFHQMLKQTELKVEVPCSCDVSSRAFLEVQRVFPSPSVDIPLIYRDFSDSLFNDPRQLQKYKFAYVRPRATSFRNFISTVLDPTSPYFRDRDTSRVSPCALHSEGQTRRLAMHSVSQAMSEFTFDSQFEGGNLDKALWTKESEFNLFLTSDTNTRGHTQWFYFAVRNIHKDKSITINIMNFSKNGSLFSRGMRPAVLSLQRLKKLGHKWTRGGYDVRYWKNSIPRRGRTRISHYYSLSFNYTFMFDNDTVYFAYSEPYPYSKLRLFLDKQRLSCPPGIVWEESVLCRTLGGLDVPLIKIREEASKPKRHITVTARVHPGETVGSFMCEGFLSFATSQTEEAVKLRRQFDIVVIPMLNPDGVVVGNTRTSLAGVDLNRRWRDPLEDLFPTIAAAKQVSRTSSAFIDLHGHSKKEFCFMYGNRYPRKDPSYWRVRFLPLLLSKLTDFFSFSNTRFFTERCHAQSARAVLFAQFGLIHSFTLEASFHGCVSGGAKKEFYSNDFRTVGAKMGAALSGLFKNEGHLYESRLTYETINELSLKYRDELERRHRHARLHQRSSNQIKELAEICADLEKTVVSVDSPEIQGSSSEDEEEESSGSDSEPSFDNLESEELEAVQTNIRRVFAESQPHSLPAMLEPSVPISEVEQKFQEPVRVLERFAGLSTEDKKKRQVPNYLSYVETGRSILTSQHTHRIWTQRLLSSKRKLRTKQETRMGASPPPERHSVVRFRQNHGSFETYLAKVQKKASVSNKLPPLM
jgi:hypothetical protein